MDITEYVVRQLPSRRIAARTAVITDADRIGDVVEPLFNEVYRALEQEGARAETGVALYEMDGEAMRATIGYDHDGPGITGLEIVELPATAVVCAAHWGALTTIGDSWRALHEWLAANGYRTTGPAREIYLQAGPGPDDPATPERTTPEDQAGWIVELQQPVTETGPVL